MCANSFIYHVSIPNNRVIHSGLQLADNGADSSCFCVFLSSLFFPRFCHCTTGGRRERLRGGGCTCVE